MKKKNQQSQALKSYIEELSGGHVSQEVQTSSIEAHADDGARMCSDAYDGDGNTDPDDPYRQGWIKEKK